ncbi:hypothetical protein [Streptomyces sp. NPDC006610]|uniref:hypothetical protein n=1 Tax=Streptomyces sp. NPDC006610 TaxID=3154584 RepID=UPI0033ACF87A
MKQPPPTALLVLLRVLFVALAVFSLGLLTWVMLLRLAAVTRKSLHWGLFVAVLAIDILSLVLLGTEPGDEIHTTGGWTGLILLLGTLVVVIAYYIAAEVRHYHDVRYGIPAGRATASYGYPNPAATAPYTTAATGPQPVVHPAPPHTPIPGPPPPVPAQPHTPIPGPGTPAHTPPPQRPAPARIDQVRAELDELSDYLRKQGGQGGHSGRGDGGEGAR